jgi:hypothetical protein
MTKTQILIAGAALVIAAAAYAQTGGHGSHGARENAGVYSQGGNQNGRQGNPSYGQGGDPNALQGTPPNYGEDDQEAYQSVWPGSAPNEAAYRRGGDRDSHGGRRHWHHNRWKAGAGDRWTIGDWTVDGAWENGESHYSLTASAPPDDLHGPDLFLRCRDGQFDLSLIDEREQARGLYAILVMTDKSAPGIVLRVRRGDPEWYGHATVAAAVAEHALANAGKIYVRLKYERGGIDDESYDFKDLAIGKPQLYRICPPPPRAQWTYDADRDGDRRHGHDGYDGHERRDGHDRHNSYDGRDRRHGHDRHWHPQWRPPPINPPRYRDLTQERDIRDQHKAAMKNGGRTGH